RGMIPTRIPREFTIQITDCHTNHCACRGRLDSTMVSSSSRKSKLCQRKPPSLLATRCHKLKRFPASGDTPTPGLADFPFSCILWSRFFSRRDYRERRDDLSWRNLLCGLCDLGGKSSFMVSCFILPHAPLDSGRRLFQICAI